MVSRSTDSMDRLIGTRVPAMTRRRNRGYVIGLRDREIRIGGFHVVDRNHVLGACREHDDKVHFGTQGHMLPRLAAGPYKGKASIVSPRHVHEEIPCTGRRIAPQTDRLKGVARSV